MFVRPRYHWTVAGMAAFYLLMAVLALRRGTPVMGYLYLGVGALVGVAWASTYTTLSNGVLTNRKFFLRYSLPVSEITRIAPHEKSKQWGYGTVVNVFSRYGSPLTLQPSRLQPFLKALHEQAPQAEYLF